MLERFKSVIEFSCHTFCLRLKVAGLGDITFGSVAKTEYLTMKSRKLYRVNTTIHSTFWLVTELCMQ